MPDPGAMPNPPRQVNRAPSAAAIRSRHGAGSSPSRTSAAAPACWIANTAASRSAVVCVTTATRSPGCTPCSVTQRTAPCAVGPASSRTALVSALVQRAGETSCLTGGSAGTGSAFARISTSLSRRSRSPSNPASASSTRAVNSCAVRASNRLVAKHMSMSMPDSSISTSSARSYLAPVVGTTTGVRLTSPISTVPDRPGDTASRTSNSGGRDRSRSGASSSTSRSNGRSALAYARRQRRRRR